MLDPNFILVIQTLVIDIKMFVKQDFNFCIRSCLHSHLEKSRFLSEKPFAKLFIPTISKSANKMRDCVIGFILFVFFNTWVSVLSPIQPPFECKFSLVSVLINFLCNFILVFVSVIPKNLKF